MGAGLRSRRDCGMGGGGAVGGMGGVAVGGVGAGGCGGGFMVEDGRGGAGRGDEEMSWTR